MANTVFFSWQSDTPNNISHGFIGSILEKVCAEITAGGTFGEVLLDSDTRGVAGQPPVTDTILKKIDASAVFVADLTFTGKRLDGIRPTPNPNVLIEYGWALKSLVNHGRFICIMNAAYGEPSRENLPFDLGHLRFPITYRLSEETTPEDKAKEKQLLYKTLKKAVLESLETLPQPKTEPSQEFHPVEPKDGPARFRAQNEAIGIESGFPSLGNSPKSIFLSHGPAMWLRLMPKQKIEKEWSTYEMQQLLFTGNNTSTLMPMFPGSGWSPLRGEDGIGVYNGQKGEMMNVPNSIEVADVAYAFKSGEIWAVDTHYLSSDTERIPFIEGYYEQRIVGYGEFLKLLGINPPFHWIAGMTNAKNRRLIRPDTNTQRFISAPLICLSDTIQAEGDYDGTNGHAALLPFFKKIFEVCGVPRPNYEE